MAQDDTFAGGSIASLARGACCLLAAAAAEGKDARQLVSVTVRERYLRRGDWGRHGCSSRHASVPELPAASPDARLLLLGTPGGRVESLKNDCGGAEHAQA